MLAWLGENIGTVVITLVLIVAVILIISKMHKDKKMGKSSCGGNCGHCQMGCACHKE